MESNSDSEWATKATGSDDEISNISSNESDKLKINEDSMTSNSNSGSKVEILENIVICPSGKTTKKCHFCEKNILSAGFDEHLKIHEITFFHCQYEGCCKKFKRKSSLRKHNYIHKGKFKYECKDCNIKFIDLIKYQNHENVKHKKSQSKNFTCKEEDCGKSFATIDYLRQHQITHKGMKFHIKCIKISFNFIILISDEYKYSCNECNLKFKWMSSWQSHKLIHNKLDINLKCKFCIKTFSNQRTLDRHVKIHKNIKFKCQICDKINSSRKDNIRRHIRHLHSDVDKSKVSDFIIEFQETNFDNSIDDEKSSSEPELEINENLKTSPIQLQKQEQIMSNRVGVITSVGNPNKNLNSQIDNFQPPSTQPISNKTQETEIKLPPKKNPIALNQTITTNQQQQQPVKPKYDPIEHYRKILLGAYKEDDHLDDEQEHEHEAPTQIHWRKRASQNFLHHQ